MRRKWAADLTLYLPALLISFVIRLIAKQGETETRKIEAQVRLLGVPPNVSTLVNNPKVDLIYPKIFLKNVMEPNALTVVLEPKSIEEWAGVERYGSQSYSITPSMVDTGDLPSSVKVLGVEDVTAAPEMGRRSPTCFTAMCYGRPGRSCRIRTAAQSTSRRQPWG